MGAPYYVAPGYNAHFAHRVKKAVKIPVSVAGRINDPHVAEEILEGNKVELTLTKELTVAPNLFCHGKNLFGSI